MYRLHEELKKTCAKYEKDLQHVQQLNCFMKDQIDILQRQLLAPSEHQKLIAQFSTQCKQNIFCLLQFLLPYILY